MSREVKVNVTVREEGDKADPSLYSSALNRVKVLSWAECKGCMCPGCRELNQLVAAGILVPGIDFYDDTDDSDDDFYDGLADEDEGDDSFLSPIKEDE